jgi:adenosylcobinamide-GDP ribazoletransferase
MKAVSRELSRIGAALSFLTVLPVPGKKVLEGSSAYFPLAGWLVGGALYLVWTASRGLPVLVQAFITVAAWELMSRGLHLDALADTADAFIAGGSRERVLGIMSDSATGAFGVAAIALALLGKFALLGSLGFHDGRGALVCAAVMGRYSLSLLCCIFRPAKEEGLGSLIISGSGPRELVIATVIGLAPLAAVFRWHALYAASGLAVALALALYARLKVGGLTGDVVGAGLELAELAALFSFL